MTFVVNKAGTDAMTTTKDSSYVAVNRQLASTAAVMAATPQFSGEMVTTLDGGLTFQAYSTATGAWQQLSLTG